MFMLYLYLLSRPVQKILKYNLDIILKSQLSGYKNLFAPNILNLTILL